MKTGSKPIIAALLLFASSVLYANENDSGNRDFYGDIGYLPLVVHLPYNVKLEPQLARYVLGLRLKENLDFEGMVGATTDGDKSVRATIGGLYMKPKLAITQSTTFFMRIGANRTLLDERASGSLTRLAYGYGLQTKIDDNLYCQVDYMHFGSTNSQRSVQGATISLGVIF